MAWLINAIQLEKFRKNQKHVAILDASWHLPTEGRHAKHEFLNNHIIGAKFLDLDAFHDNETTLTNMLLHDEKRISDKVGALGITNEYKIIFYDNSNLHTSCRALWMFKIFGHNPNQLYILDGGYKAWEKYSGKIETDESHSLAKTYTLHFENRYLRTLQQMKANLHEPKEQVIDLRHPVRYAGGPEVRQDLRLGHIPGSFSFPFFTMFDDQGCFKPLERIRKQLMGIGIELSIPIITTCGSGITSAILNFVLDLMHYHENSLYDGSWAEWGASELYPGEASLSERPVETSLEK